MNSQRVVWRLVAAGFAGVIVVFWTMSFAFGLIIAAAVFAVLSVLA